MFFKRVHRYLIAFISLTGGIIGYVVSDLSAGAVTGLLIGAVVGALVAVSVLDDNQVPRRYDE